MATLHPALLSIQPTSLGGYRERDALAMLEQGLPDGFDVFHSVDWSAMHLGKQSFGEVDGQDTVNQVGQEITKRNMSAQPKLTIRPGFPMRVMASKDLILRPYQPLTFVRGSLQ